MENLQHGQPLLHGQQGPEQCWPCVSVGRNVSPAQNPLSSIRDMLGKNGPETSYHQVCRVLWGQNSLQVMLLSHFPKERFFSSGVHCHCCIGHWGEVSRSLNFFSLPVQPNHHSQKGLFKSSTYNTKGIMLSVASPLITNDNTVIIWYFLVQVAWKRHSQASFCGYFLWQSTALLSCYLEINTGIRESPHVFYSQVCWWLAPSHLWVHEGPAAPLGLFLCWAQDLSAHGENRNFPISPQHHCSLSIPVLKTNGRAFGNHPQGFSCRRNIVWRRLQLPSKAWCEMLSLSTTLGRGWPAGIG